MRLNDGDEVVSLALVDKVEDDDDSAEADDSQAELVQDDKKASTKPKKN